jgi:hypothetical protein
MSEKHDALSQWRAYGNAEYCIGFNSVKLVEKIRDAQLIKVTYVKEPIIDAGVEGRLNQFFTDHTVHILQDGTIDQELLSDGASEFFGSDRLYDAAFLSRYKDCGFHEEKEQRLVMNIHQQIVERDDRIIFQPKGRYPHARAKIKIFENPHEASDAIKTVTVGPGLNKDIAKTALSMLFSQMCFGDDWVREKIRYSRVPYRTNLV